MWFYCKIIITVFRPFLPALLSDCGFRNLMAKWRRIGPIGNTVNHVFLPTCSLREIKFIFGIDIWGNSFFQHGADIATMVLSNCSRFSGGTNSPAGFKLIKRLWSLEKIDFEQPFCLGLMPNRQTWGLESWNHQKREWRLGNISSRCCGAGDDLLHGSWFKANLALTQQIRISVAEPPGSPRSRSRLRLRLNWVG